MIKPVYDYASDSCEGLASVRITTDDKDNDDVLKNFGYIDKTGKMVIKAQYDGASDFENGIASVWIGEKRFYINKTGEYVYEP